MEARYRARSLWLDGVPSPLAPRAPLPGDLQCDVAIVGAGFTGLWTAYHLARAAPDTRIVVIEREIAGFGPSGRNGGWVSPGVAGTLSGYRDEDDVRLADPAPAPRRRRGRMERRQRDDRARVPAAGRRPRERAA